MNKKTFIKNKEAEFDKHWRMWSNDASRLNYEKIKFLFIDSLHQYDTLMKKEIEGMRKDKTHLEGSQSEGETIVRINQMTGHNWADDDIVFRGK